MSQCLSQFRRIGGQDEMMFGLMGMWMPFEDEWILHILDILARSSAPGLEPRKSDRKYR